MGIQVIAGLKEGEWLETNKSKGTVATVKSVKGWIYNSEVDMPTIKKVFEEALKDIEAGKEEAPSFECLSNAFKNIQILTSKYKDNKGFEEALALKEIYEATYPKYKELYDLKDVPGIALRRQRSQLKTIGYEKDETAADAALPAKELSEKAISVREAIAARKKEAEEARLARVEFMKKPVKADAQKVEEVKSVIKKNRLSPDCDVKNLFAEIITARRWKFIDA